MSLFAGKVSSHVTMSVFNSLRVTRNMFQEVNFTLIGRIRILIIIKQGAYHDIERSWIEYTKSTGRRLIPG